MTTNNSNNQIYSNEADGFILGGGATKRKLTLSGGDVAVTGSGSAVITFPGTTGTLAKLTDITGTNSGTNTGDQTKTSLGLGNVDNTSDATKKLDIMQSLNPIGTIYTNKTDATNPATLFGFGTW